MSIEAAYLRDPDLDVELLAMRDEHGATFEVQRSLVLDDQDRALGMDTYCLVEDSGPSHYGGVAGWELTDEGVLLLDLEPGAADALGLPGHLELPLDPAALAAVREHLPRLVGPTA